MLGKWCVTHAKPEPWLCETPSTTTVANDPAHFLMYTCYKQSPHKRTFDKGPSQTHTQLGSADRGTQTANTTGLHRPLPLHTPVTPAVNSHCSHQWNTVLTPIYTYVRNYHWCTCPVQKSKSLLFRHVFRLHHCVQSAVSLNFR